MFCWGEMGKRSIGLLNRFKSKPKLKNMVLSIYVDSMQFLISEWNIFELQSLIYMHWSVKNMPYFTNFVVTFLISSCVIPGHVYHCTHCLFSGLNSLRVVTSSNYISIGPLRKPWKYYMTFQAISIHWSLSQGPFSQEEKCVFSPPAVGD